ncbi:tyrosinase-like [Bufo gargarizans]|uniref:tyrosinase-like n=1 Tax=Bufo gargarizans TaxID=30331 RepID=UPI001CF452EF|nr:tyrosinase-like [Bufo gargarizans]
MLFLSVFLLFLVATDAEIFPKVCIPPGTKNFPVPCCPLYKGTPCGSGENRGSCVSTSLSRSLPPPDNLNDERENFPARFFSSICQCKDNFYGINCGKCFGNRYGDNCENQRILIRSEFREKSETEQQLFLAQMDFCKYEIDPDYYILRAGDRLRSGTFEFLSASYYDVWCFGHYYVSKSFLINGTETSRIDGAHRSTAFTTWHRLFLIHLEKRMQECLKDPTFALVYYDWRSEKHCALCNNDLLGASDDQGYLHPQSIFAEWRMICASYRYGSTYCLMSDCICERPKITRRPGAAVSSSIPTIEDIDYCLNLPNFDTEPYTTSSRRSARNCIEGFVNRFELPGTAAHNMFHVYCGGTMSQVPISCSDPIFVLHHTMIDK